MLPTIKALAQLAQGSPVQTPRPAGNIALPAGTTTAAQTIRFYNAIRSEAGSVSVAGLSVLKGDILSLNGLTGAFSITDNVAAVTVPTTPNGTYTVVDGVYNVDIVAPVGTYTVGDNIQLNFGAIAMPDGRSIGAATATIDWS